MQTTSSETSARLSTGSSRNALVAWLCVAVAFVALGFVGASSGQTDPNVLYKYSFAVGSTVIYAVFVAITLVIANLIGSPTATAGLNRFSWRWVWIAVGLIVVVLLF